MRLSADEKSPYFSAVSYWATVHVNGAKVDNCREADTVAGWADCYKANPIDDKYELDAYGEIVIERQYGEITITFNKPTETVNAQ